MIKCTIVVCDGALDKPLREVPFECNDEQLARLPMRATFMAADTLEREPHEVRLLEYDVPERRIYIDVVQPTPESVLVFFEDNLCFDDVIFQTRDPAIARTLRTMVGVDPVRMQHDVMRCGAYPSHLFRRALVGGYRVRRFDEFVNEVPVLTGISLRKEK